MEKYDITVVEYPKKRLMGMKVRTSMQKARADCPALFESFIPRVSELPAGSCSNGFYGVSKMVNTEDLDYWAAVEMTEGSSIPEGMECVDIPSGEYAKCAVPNMEKLGETYMYIYDEWPKNQTKYVMDGYSPSFELYPANWQHGASFEIYAPVKKN